jgi:HSP20 family protein
MRMAARRMSIERNRPRRFEAMSQTSMERRSLNVPERWDPPTDFEQLNERMRRMLEQTFGGIVGAVPGDKQIWSPLVDIEEQDDAYVLEADLPGVKREDVKVEQIGNELLISGEFKERERKGVLRKQTRRVGSFGYRIALPEQFNSENIEAKLTNGVLTVRVPKAQKAQRRQVEIKS